MIDLENVFACFLLALTLAHTHTHLHKRGFLDGLLRFFKQSMTMTTTTTHKTHSIHRQISTYTRTQHHSWNRSMNTSFARVTVAKLSIPFCVVLLFSVLFPSEADKLRNWSMWLRLVAVILPKCLRFFFLRTMKTIDMIKTRLHPSLPHDACVCIWSVCVCVLRELTAITMLHAIQKFNGIKRWSGKGKRIEKKRNTKFTKHNNFILQTWSLV